MALPFLLPAAVAIASEVFPLIAARFGGARGAQIAESVVETAADLAGAAGERDPQAILAALRTEPAKLDALRFRLAELDAEAHRRELEDRDSARLYQTALGPGGRRRGDVMLVAVSLGLALCVGGAVLLPRLAPGDAAGPVIALMTTVAGALLKMLSDAFAFEFGSSKGSKEKDAQIAAISADFARLLSDRVTKAAAEPRVEPSAAAPAEAAAPAPAAKPRRAFVEALVAGAI